MTSSAQIAQAIYLNGVILTMEDGQPTAKAIAVADGVILAIGPEPIVMDHRGPSTEIHDLAGATLMPGFVGSHSHMVISSRKLAAVPMDSPPIGDIASIADIQAALRAELERVPRQGEHWLIGWGYDHASLAEMRHPDKRDLDDVSTDVPIFLYHFSAHQAVVNSKALELLGIDAAMPDPEGGVIARMPGSREPSGLLEETAMISANLMAMRSLVEHTDAMALVENAVEAYAAKGFTTVVECGARPGDIRILEQMAEAGRLKLDVAAFAFYAFTAPEDAIEKYRPDYENRYRLAGLKLLLDGGSPGRTAYLREPYHRQLPGEVDYRGYARIAQPEINDTVARCFKCDLPLIIHALGDAALDQCIAALNVGQYVAPGEDRRTQLIHLQQVQEDQFDRLRDLDVTLTFQVAHNFYFGDFHEEQIYGPARTARLNPIASALERGLSSTIHHDSPVHPIDQLFLVWTAVNRLTRSGRVIGPAQRISVLDALKACTINAAYQWREEDRKGSLAPGKLADFVVLDRNPLDIDPEEIKDIRILETIKEGQTIYRAD